MAKEKREPSGIVAAVSKRAGAYTGMATAIGKKIGSVGAGSVTAVGDLLARPAKGAKRATDEAIEPTSEPSAVEPKAEEAAGQEDASNASENGKLSIAIT